MSGVTSFSKSLMVADQEKVYGLLTFGSLSGELTILFNLQQVMQERCSSDFSSYFRGKDPFTFYWNVLYFSGSKYSAEFLMQNTPRLGSAAPALGKHAVAHH